MRCLSNNFNVCSNSFAFFAINEVVASRGNFLHKSTDFDETFGDPKEKEKEYDDDENLSQAWWRVFHRAILLVVSQNYHDRSESASE